MILSPEDCSCPLVDTGPSLVNSPFCSGTIYFMVLLQAYLKGRCNIASPCERVQSVEEVKSEYDFIVVGAGSAGSIVASRLAENMNFKVLLLEAGGYEPIGARPPSFYRTFWQSEKLNWGYHTEPADYCLEQKGKGCEWPRGKGLGGSSLLNGMAYHRGHAKDYEGWVQEGATGWSWEENLPYFDMTENNKQIGTLVSSKYHSDKGPLPVQQFNYQPKELQDFMEAVKEAGFEVITDMNDPDTPDGFVLAQTFTDNGQRYTTARAYLEGNPHRSNLDVKLNAHVSKVVFAEQKAKGVEYIDENGHTKYVASSKEVILSAGALNSPQILMLSGIGPRETLEPLNIPVVADLPVGKLLRNHYGMTVYYRLTKMENTDLLDWNALTEYLLTRRGPMSSTAITQLTGLLYSSFADKKQKQPDLQYFFNGFYAECSRTGVIGEISDPSANGRNVSANVAMLLPRSEGYMTINSTDPFAQPLFFPGYFEHPEDLLVLREGAMNLRKIFESDVMKNKYGAELDNSTTAWCGDYLEWSDPWVECMARVYTDPQNHQTSTAAMGRVLDPELRVLGIEGLRVIDAAAIPKQVTGNPQGPIMMVAERGAEFIKKTWS